MPLKGWTLPEVVVIDGHRMTPYSCACCKKCWVYVEGKHEGRCLHGGPYKGYEEVK